MNELIKRVFGILFVAGDDGVSRQELAQSLEEPISNIDDCLEQLKLNFQTDDSSALEVVNFNQRYRLITKKELAEDVEKYAQAPFSQNLTRASIETLSIVAYRQPITRMAIDEIRGVSSSSLIQKLISRDLIKEIGRIEAPGRPVLYGVTDYFMDYFGLKTLDDLPEIEPIALNAELSSEELFDLKEWPIELYDEENNQNEDE
ncbi:MULTISPECIES: SMC-Scp complex subunit ScpB [Ruoffia]|uniref:Segregation and condensation protein B n=1 Tax=Ruoffia tabacinasalis TaxID=87458 RepID=A0A5R9EIP1_9LACT|nr:SMC-Scp complex subunit ScpB [Ruoffia tabacinasalis]MBG9977323.1 SMC-Scp complex subunit ScpB [Ruoffia tabacinasalis]TLQ49180.1 SMC-Scp complex subunit ScpB [Ruoffia tabacinasalis]HJG47551.1 SMC-Scp complex subunit ScpB [Ruoffia tabacinasalis]